MNRFDEQAELALARPPRQPGIPVELARERLKNEVLMQALRGGAR